MENANYIVGNDNTKKKGKMLLKCLKWIKERICNDSRILVFGKKHEWIKSAVETFQIKLIEVNTSTAKNGDVMLYRKSEASIDAWRKK